MENTANKTIVARQKVLLGFLVFTQFASVGVFGFHAALVSLLTVLMLIYFADLLFNFFLILRSFYKSPELDVKDDELNKECLEWPRYSILCPLYKEGNILKQFIHAMNKLDYPKDKLEILLLLEEDDLETIVLATAMNLPQYFRIVIVPNSHPKTKPKALNFGLEHVTGEYAVVYDAEDIPDSQQLKKAIIAFSKSPENVICMQAKLNFYNPTHNILTRVFTAEYSLWFDLVLTGLQSIGAPIPLGGTSNHFKIKALRDLKGWDPFNVTEDCDLGIRLFKKGYLTAIFNSTTLEEANSNFINWFRQRSRWIKGYIQTYFVHMRKPKEFITDWKNYHIISFQLIIGGKILSLFINPIMWVVTLSYFLFRSHVGAFIESLFPAPIFYIAVISLVAGNFLYLYYYMIGCVKREQWNLIEYVFLVPFYWLMMSVAAWIALYQLFFKPHYWEKTLHGFHLKKIISDNPAEELSLSY